MAVEDNQRGEERKTHRMRILYSVEDTGECHPVRLLNFSGTGVYFESLNRIEPGTRIVIHSKGGEQPDHEVDPVCSRYETMSRVRIKWCKELKDRDYPYFGIGGEYLAD